MIEDIKFSIGLCEVTYGDMTLTYLADKCVFSAIPKYQKVYGGKGKAIQKYLLDEYNVSLDLSLHEESYNNLKLALSHESNENGFYATPQNVDTTGKPLIIHPKQKGESKEHDIVVFRAIVDPEQEFIKVYDKKLDNLQLRFIGVPMDKGDSELLRYFYIGDWEAEGVIP